VKDTLLSFARARINLDLLALGNEIRHGILWPIGYADVDVQPWPKTVANFSNLATLWKAARAGVDDAVHAGAPRPQVMIHINDGVSLILPLISSFCTRGLGAESRKAILRAI
jgi:arabinogalactan endo-1,4-beta-galactosidase